MISRWYKERCHGIALLFCQRIRCFLFVFIWTWNILVFFPFEENQCLSIDDDVDNNRKWNQIWSYKIMKIDFVWISYNNWYYNNQRRHLDQRNSMNLVYNLRHNLWILEKLDWVHELCLSNKRTEVNISFR
jgi:hypothetical protein